MSWVPPGRAPEHILAYAGEGAGKSTGAGMIARRMPSTSTMYIIDTDHAWTALVERIFTDLPIKLWYEGKKQVAEMIREGAVNAGAGLHVIQVDGWAETADALDLVFAKAKLGDWIVLDSMSDMWDDIIDFYSRQICGDDLPQFLLDWRMRMEKAGDGDKAKRQGTVGSLMEEGLYDYVNPEWHLHVSRPMKATKAHLYGTAQATTINPRDGADIKGSYDGFGLKPRVQKKVGNNVGTVVLLGKGKTGKRQLSVVKNWGREQEGEVRDQVYEDLSKELLFRYGWRPAKKERADV